MIKGETRPYGAGMPRVAAVLVYTQTEKLTAQPGRNSAVPSVQGTENPLAGCLSLAAHVLIREECGQGV
jgi:hypothetical protein